MSLSFANTAGNLFNRLGRYGKLADKGATFQADLYTYFGQLLAQYDSSVATPLLESVSGVASLRDSTREAVVAAYMDALKSAAADTIVRMVRADKPTSADSLTSALYEVYLQMQTAGATIKKCTVAASTAAAAGNSGDGVLVATAKRGDGRDQELIIPEAAYVRVTADSQTGGQTVARESLTYLGEAASRGVWSPDYPYGSGQIASLVAIDAGQDGSAGTTTQNVLVNGNFEGAFTTGVPANWTLQTGVGNTDLQQGATVYSGTKSLQFVGGATNTAVYQALANAGGTLYQPLPQTGYAIAFWARTSNVPAAGVMTVELVDGNSTVINDDQGVANSFTVNLVTLGTTFVPQTGSFRLPKSVPATIRLRLRLSTALSAGTNLFVDRVGLGRHVATYPGGPGIAAFSGANKFVLGDYFTLTTSNDFGGASNLDTFQWLLDRLFNTRTLGILMPSNAAPSVADTLITA
jgi:hypothetical protein